MDTDTTAPLAMTRYTLDARGSRFTVRATATGLLSAFGHNPTIAIRDFSGDVQFSPEALDAGSLTLRIITASLAVQDDISDKDRREIERVVRDEVLEVAKFPEILFTSTGVSGETTGDGRVRVNIAGNLTLHGVTRSQRIASQLFLMGGMMRVQGEFTVRQTDFGITLVSVAGGALKLKDELACSFDIVARKAA
jgi:polyisoprenoid-binding protein YceI